IAYAEEMRVPFSEVNWLFKSTKKLELKPTFKINSLFGMLKAVESGVGIAALPDYMMEGATHISKILKEMHGPATDVYFTYPSELRNSKRIRVFREFLMRKLAEFRF